MPMSSAGKPKRRKGLKRRSKPLVISIGAVVSVKSVAATMAAASPRSEKGPQAQALSGQYVLGKGQRQRRADQA